VNEPVLMHTYIDESTEVRDTRDRAFKYHAGLQVLDVVDPFGERRSFELGAGSRPGFASSSKISHTVGKPKRKQPTESFSPDILIASGPQRERRSIQRRWVLRIELKAGEKWKRRLCKAARGHASTQATGSRT
jgi:hypothetical protein